MNVVPLHPPSPRITSSPLLLDEEDAEQPFVAMADSYFIPRKTDPEVHRR